MLAAYLRLALLGGFEVGLSSALPAFLSKASSCIVFPSVSTDDAATRTPARILGS